MSPYLGLLRVFPSLYFMRKLLTFGHEGAVDCAGRCLFLSCFASCSNCLDATAFITTRVKSYFRLRIQASPVSVFSMIKKINLIIPTRHNTQKTDFPNLVI